jgi:cell volume regulation protein A
VAVYLVGLALGDAPLADRNAVIAFHRGLAMVAEIGMFFALGLLVFPSQFGPVAIKAVLLAIITALVARPIAAAVATVRQGFLRSERVLLAWGGLRGAVPVILATFAVIDHVPRSVEILNIVFFSVMVSAAVQGPTVHALAARLRMPDHEEPPSPQPDDEGTGPAVESPARSAGAPVEERDARLQVVALGQHGN